MKRLSIFLLILFFVSIFISAKNSEISLDSSITETPLTYELYRKLEDKSLTVIEEDSIYVIDEINPLSTNTMITDFTIRVNSNLNSERNVSVEVTPETFKTILNGDQIYDSKVTPIINTIINRPIVSAGVNENKEVYRFNIYICGRKNLPAGIYTCNVDVKYTIE